ncbi:BtpA/SgcQ family protein [Elioraea sp.]|uniref:BtpA/SgcQ family protein n=1 Tax=Elioraea sp. TaxID=2185103 RepID=UPI0025C23434|nr:BtpA/SgcQ family protein [Elioraea sp.]
MTAHPLFSAPPLVIAALHLPALGPGGARDIAELEDYVLANARVFHDAGIPAVKIQDQTRVPAEATAETIAVTAMLAALVRRSFPGLAVGIIVQAHDAAAPLAIAHAAGASFVRLKVFAGAAVTAEGTRQALGPTATAYRAALGRPDIAILADVQDRTSVPLGDVPAERAALWNEGLGADALVITGSDFADTLARIAVARAAGTKRPIVIGGSVDETNVGAALGTADGVIVSTSLRARQAKGNVLWDAARCRAFMDAARSARPA